jgi:hypothetical protein
MPDAMPRWNDLRMALSSAARERRPLALPRR